MSHTSVTDTPQVQHVQQRTIDPHIAAPADYSCGELLLAVMIALSH